MCENRIVNSYRELSIKLTSCTKLLKQVNDDLARVKYPCKHRNILLHEKLQLEAMKNSINLNIRKFADDLDASVIKSVLA